MTDHYSGNTPHSDDDHPEKLPGEHEAVHEMPSDYEFADDHGAVASEENADDLTIATPVETGSGRRSPFIAIAAAAGGLVILGGLGWWQFGHKHATVATQTVSAPKPVMMAQPVMPSAPLAPRTDAAALTAQPVAVATPAAIPQQAAPQQTIPQQAPQAAASAGPQAAANPAAQANIPLATATAIATAIDRVEQQKINALSGRIDALQQSVEQASQQLSQVNATAAATTGNKQLQDRIDALEHQIAQMKRGATRTVGVPVARAPAMATAKTEPDEEAPPARRPAKRRDEKPAAPTWILRAASPGQAWVSSGPASADLKPLHVGDSLPGLGRVIAIQQQSGGWIVRGTKGTLE